MSTLLQVFPKQSKGSLQDLLVYEVEDQRQNRKMQTAEEQCRQAATKTSRSMTYEGGKISKVS